MAVRIFRDVRGWSLVLSWEVLLLTPRIPNCRKLTFYTSTQGFQQQSVASEGDDDRTPNYLSARCTLATTRLWDFWDPGRHSVGDTQKVWLLYCWCDKLFLIWSKIPATDPFFWLASSDELDWVRSQEPLETLKRLEEFWWRLHVEEGKGLERK